MTSTLSLCLFCIAHMYAIPESFRVSIVFFLVVTLLSFFILRVVIYRARKPIKTVDWSTPVLAWVLILLPVFSISIYCSSLINNGQPQYFSLLSIGVSISYAISDLWDLRKR
jgi:FtsH-binding integral membrane protein